MHSLADCKMGTLVKLFNNEVAVIVDKRDRNKQFFRIMDETGYSQWLHYSKFELIDIDKNNAVHNSLIEYEKEYKKFVRAKTRYHNTIWNYPLVINNDKAEIKELKGKNTLKVGTIINCCNDDKIVIFSKDNYKESTDNDSFIEVRYFGINQRGLLAVYPEDSFVNIEKNNKENTYHIYFSACTRRYKKLLKIEKVLKEIMLTFPNLNKLNLENELIFI